MFGSRKPSFSARELLDGYVQRLLAIKHLLLFGFVVLIFGCFVDFATVTGPQVSALNNAQENLGRWPMPATLKSNMNADLHSLVFYVVAGEVAKWLIVLVGFCFVFLAVDVIIVTLSFCFQRSGSLQGAVDLATLFNLEKGLFRRERTANSCLFLTIMGAVFVSLFLEGAEVWLPSAFFLLFALIEGWKSRRQNSLIFALPRSQRGPAFNWLTQRGWYDFLAPLLGGLALVYFLFPALYVAALLLMKKVLHPLVHSVDKHYANEIWAAVKQYHTIILNEIVGLTIPRFDILYTPKSGIGELWLNFAPLAVQYITPAVFVLLVCRLVVPWYFSFDNRSAVLRVAIGFVLAEAALKGFEYAVDHWLGIPVAESPALALVAIVFALMFALLFHQSLIERSTYCQNGHRNPEEAEFCNKCGLKVGPKGVSRNTLGAD